MRYTRQKLQLEHNNGEVSEKVTPSGPTLCTWVTSEGGEMPEMSFFFSGDRFMLVFCDILVFTHSA